MVLDYLNADGGVIVQNVEPGGVNSLLLGAQLAALADPSKIESERAALERSYTPGSPNFPLAS
jgi:hypothetical protein